MSRLVFNFALLLITGTILFVLSGCSAQKRAIEPPVEVPQDFSDSGRNITPDRWWTSFNDDQLNAIIDSAMQDNFDLLTAWERLRASRALVDRESSSLFPTLEATGGAEATRTDDPSNNSEVFMLGAAAGYEVDLWGRIQSAVEAERFRADATFADFQTTALTLSAEITRTWYQLADAQNQVNLIDEQIETNLTVLELLKNRLPTQQVQGVDIIRQEQLIEATREQKINADVRVKTLQNKLAVLQGHTPQNGGQFAPEFLPEPLELPDTGIPLDLVERRPDVKFAFYSLMAADRDLASAISNQYPRLTLSASAATSADNAGNLFQTWALSFAGNLLAPIFYGGELRAEVDRNEAVKQQRLYEYGQAILIAFREVEDAIVREQRQRQAIRSVERQVDLANQAYRQLRLRYLNGDADYLDVITSLDDIQQLRRDLLSARLLLVEFRISLYRALAGSFDMSINEAE
ncbi:efflux transporter outer membrane subunit [Rhodohalobacter sp. 8-1]|uniref:efflux transporter outer membrane subunit n=1 Tax=Rhodohalobacter sp. 8-1 TaxID=3131972 RepID=UPI0030EEFF92